MKNEEIYKYVNSRDIRAYLRKTEYQFSAPEAVYLISQAAGLSVDQKRAAFSDVMSTMPDSHEEIPHAIKDAMRELGLFEIVRRHLAAERFLLDYFFSEEAGAVYIARKCASYERQRRRKRPAYRNEPFLTWTDCGDVPPHASFCGALEGEREEDAPPAFVEVHKCFVDSEFAMGAVLDSKGAPYRIFADFARAPEEYRKYIRDLEPFGKMRIALPTPFKTGDILCSRYWDENFGDSRGPFALAEAADGEGKNGNDPEPDMRGYFVYESGTVYRGRTPGTDVEYYRGNYPHPLTVLPLLHDAMKDRPDSIFGDIKYDRLLEGYHQFRLKAASAQAMEYACFTEDSRKEYQLGEYRSPKGYSYPDEKGEE